MPLTAKGSKILGRMKSEYGDKKGKSVFYASINKGKISGAHRDGRDDKVSKVKKIRSSRPKY